MEIPAYGTVIALVLFIIVGLMPMIPALVRASIQIVAGVGIYFGMSQAMFDLPYGDDLPIGMMFGGSGGEAGFNKYAFGFVAMVLGLLFTGLGALAQKLFGKKE